MILTPSFKIWIILALLFLFLELLFRKGFFSSMALASLSVGIISQYNLLTSSIHNTLSLLFLGFFFAWIFRDGVDQSY